MADRTWRASTLYLIYKCSRWQGIKCFSWSALPFHIDKTQLEHRPGWFLVLKEKWPAVSVSGFVLAALSTVICQAYVHKEGSLNGWTRSGRLHYLSLIQVQAWEVGGRVKQSVLQKEHPIFTG